MKLPRFKANVPLLEQLTESRLNAILDKIDANELQPSATVRVIKGPGGTMAEVKKNRVAGIDHPFKVTLLGDTATYIMVRIGVLYVSGSPVTITIDGNVLSNTTTDNTLAITLGTGGYVGLLLTVDDTDPYAISCSACEINFEATEPANTLTERWIRLAGISEAGLVNQEIYGSIYTARAGDYEETDSLQIW